MYAPSPFDGLWMFGYQLIYADPPWPFDNWSERGGDRNANERARMADILGQLRAALEKVDAKTLKSWSDKITAPELLNRETGNPFVMTREMVVSIALNTGNQGNFDKLRQSQGAGAAKDLAAIQSGRGTFGEAAKLLTMFYSYMSAFYQRQRTFARDVRGASLSDAPGLIARAWWLFVVPPLLSELLAGRTPDDDDDDESWAEWSITNIMFQIFGPVPVLRDIGPTLWAKATDRPSFGYRFTPAQGGIESVINVGSDLGKIARGKETKRATRNAIETAGYFTGLTTGQMAVAAQFLVDVGEGDANPDGIGEWWRGLTTGKTE